MVLYELTRLKKWYFDKKIKNLPETLFKTSTIVHLILHNIVFKRKVDRIIYYLNNIFFLLSNFRFYCHSKEFFSLEISKFPWLSICQINNGWWCKKKKKNTKSWYQKIYGGSYQSIKVVIRVYSSLSTLPQTFHIISNE